MVAITSQKSCIIIKDMKTCCSKAERVAKQHSGMYRSWLPITVITLRQQAEPKTHLVDKLPYFLWALLLLCVYLFSLFCKKHYASYMFFFKTVKQRNNTWGKRNPFVYIVSHFLLTAPVTIPFYFLIISSFCQAQHMF